MRTSTSLVKTSAGHRAFPVPTGAGVTWSGLAGSGLAGAARWAAVVLLATGVVVMHALLGPGPAAHATAQTSSATAAVASAPADAPKISGQQSGQQSGQVSGHDCVHCQGADHATSLGHLCLAVAGGLLLAGVAAWARRRHRLPALDLDVRLVGRARRLPARVVLGVPPWTHLSLAQLSLLRV